MSQFYTPWLQSLNWIIISRIIISCVLGCKNETDKNLTVCYCNRAGTTDDNYCNGDLFIPYNETDDSTSDAASQSLTLRVIPILCLTVFLKIVMTRFLWKKFRSLKSRAKWFMMTSEFSFYLWEFSIWWQRQQSPYQSLITFPNNCEKEVNGCGN